MTADENSRLTPQRAAFLGRLGALSLHARGKTTTVAARAAFASRFVAEARALAAAQGEELSDVEAERRAAYLRRAHFTRLGLRSAEARRSRRRRVPKVPPPPGESGG